MGDVGETPLARLFAIGMRALVDDLHTRLESRGWPPMRRVFGFVLVGVRRQEMTTTEIAALLGVTKQAASSLIVDMAAEGFVQYVPHPTDSRAKLVRLTPRGELLLETVEDIYREIEAEWADRIGRESLEAIRSDLVTALTVEGRLPPIRPTM